MEQVGFMVQLRRLLTTIEKRLSRKESDQASDEASSSPPTPLYNMENVHALVDALYKRELIHLLKNVPEYASVRKKLGGKSHKSEMVQLLAKHVDQESHVEPLLEWAQGHVAQSSLPGFAAHHSSAQLPPL